MKLIKILLHFKIFAETIKIEHTIFALPFAILTCFITVNGIPNIFDFLLIILCMISMRTVAMLANRIIDRDVDRLNPRTKNRTLVTGKFSETSGIIYIIVFVILYFLCVFQLHKSSWILSPIPLVVTVFYSYLKRFTWLCHFGIGLVYLIVPPAVQIALVGKFDTWAVIIGFAGALWVSGFDILYGIFDIESDRHIGIKSIPARFGINVSLILTKSVHALSLIFLFLAGYFFEAGLIYYLGVIISGILLSYENYIVRADDTSRLNTAFFNMNGFIAINYLIISVGDILI